MKITAHKSMTARLFALTGRTGRETFWKTTVTGRRGGKGYVMSPPAHQSQKKAQHILLVWKSIQHLSWSSCSKVKGKSQAYCFPRRLKTGVWMFFKGAGK